MVADYSMDSGLRRNDGLIIWVNLERERHAYSKNPGFPRMTTSEIGNKKARGTWLRAFKSI